MLMSGLCAWVRDLHAWLRGPLQHSFVSDAGMVIDLACHLTLPTGRIQEVDVS